MSAARRNPRAHAAALICVALFLRLWGIDFGLPLLSNLYIRPDESLTLTAALQQLLTPGDPQLYAYPALQPTLVSLAYALLYGARRALGLAQEAGVLRDWTLHLSAYTLAARGVSALFGVATVAMSGRLAYAITGQARAGWIAAWLYALAPLPVREAHFATVDTVMTFASTGWALCLWQFTKLEPLRPTRNLIGASVFAALAVACKYHMGVLVPVTLTLALVTNAGWVSAGRPRPMSWPRLTGITMLLPGAIWLALNPAFVFDSGRYCDALRNLRDNLGVISDGALIVPLWKVLLRPIAFMRWGPGGLAGLMVAVAGFGVVLADTRKTRWQKLSLIAILAALAGPLLLTRFLPFRYLLPLMPCVAALAASYLARILENGGWRRGWALASLVTLLPMASSLMLDSRLARKDTRTLAGEWIQANVPRDTPIVLLTGAEAEPQIEERADSLRGRLESIREVYGEPAAAIISQPFRLRLAGAPQQAGWYVLRNPKQWPAQAEQICLVHVRHALGYGTTDRTQRAQWGGEILQRAEFRATTSSPEISLNDRDFDRTDAFFLPMSNLDQVARPGPDVSIELRRRLP